MGPFENFQKFCLFFEIYAKIGFYANLKLLFFVKKPVVSKGSFYEGLAQQYPDSFGGSKIKFLFRIDQTTY